MWLYKKSKTCNGGLNRENLEIYNKVKETPKEAQKKISGGRLNGMTDIKPMYRIEKLTEIFGACGFGWKTEIINKAIIEGANDEKIATVDINLYVKYGDKWSEAIPGTGGSSFVTKETKGLYTSDECFKMAYTDALSVACKALGIGADIYWGDSKYPTNNNAPKQENNKKASEAQINMLRKIAKDNDTFKTVAGKFGYNSSKDILAKDVNPIKAQLEKLQGGQN